MNREDINWKKTHLNATTNLKYQVTDINSNLFNIHGYHNSFTASSQLKHSFHTTYNNLYSTSMDLNSVLIEKALSRYDSEYYTRYEDIEEPNISEFNIGHLDEEWSKKEPFSANLSQIAHQHLH
jgi:hypothetical protein